MNAHDDEFLDSIAVLALGALPEGEARELAAHVASCASCRREYDEMRGTANLVGYGAEIGTSELSELSAARMKSAVMRAVRATTAAPSRRPAAAWLAYAAAAAAIVVALYSTANNASLRSAHERDLAHIAALEARANAQTSESAAADARVAAVLAPDSKRYAVPGGDVVTSGGRVYLALRHLAQPPSGKVYQAWTLASGAKAVAPSVTFVPGSGGVTVIELPEKSAGLAAVALTVEPLGGSKKPTAKPTFVRPLS